MAYKELTLKRAFRMLFETGQFGSYKFRGVDVKARGGDSFEMMVHLQQSGAITDTAEVARQLASIHSNVKQNCFQFFAQSGVLVVPELNIIPPIAE
jgi:hypothetical protein